MLALTPPELLELLVTLPADRTPFIWGPPGIGKSALVREAAELLDMPCVTLLGTQIAPEDLIGVPRIRGEGDGRFVTEFCPPRAILRSEPFLLFIDELNSAVPDPATLARFLGSLAAVATACRRRRARRHRLRPCAADAPERRCARRSAGRWST